MLILWTRQQVHSHLSRQCCLTEVFYVTGHFHLHLGQLLMQQGNVARAMRKNQGWGNCWFSSHWQHCVILSAPQKLPLLFGDEVERFHLGGGIKQPALF